MDVIKIEVGVCGLLDRRVRFLPSEDTSPFWRKTPGVPSWCGRDRLLPKQDSGQLWCRIGSYFMVLFHL